MRTSLSLLLVTVVLAGCGAAPPAATRFQTRANAICARMNTSPFLDTKALYDAHLRETRRSLGQLSRLGLSAPNPREFGDLVGSMRAIYSFDRSHESREIAIAKAGRRGLTNDVRRFAALVSRQIGGDEDVKFHDARALGLNSCSEVSTVGTLKERRSG